MKFNPDETAFLGIMAAVVIVVGVLFYFISAIFPIPGSKFILLAPFLSFVFTLILNKVKKKGTVLTFSLIMGGLLSFISIFMGAAILLTGFLTELTGLLLEGLSRKKKIIHVSAFFPFYSLLSFAIFTQFILGKIFFNQNKILLIGLVFIFVYLIGMWGAKLAFVFLKNINKN